MRLNFNFKICLIVLIAISSTLNTTAQKLNVDFFNEAGELNHSLQFEVGDIVVLAHQKEGKRVHYFEGKITGIFEERGQIRVFDYARSERAMSIIGKQISVKNIVGIVEMDKEDFKRRQHQAVATTAMSSFGAALGGSAGNSIATGSAVAGIGLDIVSREKVSKQRIKCKILEY